MQTSSVDCEGDVINFQDEKPFVIFGPSFDIEDESFPPFYLTLKINGFLLYNCRLDSKASHNLMSNIIMDQL